MPEGVRSQASPMASPLSRAATQAPLGASFNAGTIMGPAIGGGLAALVGPSATFAAVGGFDSNYSREGAPGLGFDAEFTARLWAQGYAAAALCNLARDEAARELAQQLGRAERERVHVLGHDGVRLLPTAALLLLVVDRGFRRETRPRRRR